MECRRFLKNASLLHKKWACHVGRRQWLTTGSQQARKIRNDEQQKRQDLDYCINFVRERDIDAFYCGLLMPASAQKSFFALRAFNAELASVKEIHHSRNQGGSSSTGTTAPLALQLRLQWWNDAIRQIYGEERGGGADPSLANLSISCWESPVVRALYNAHQETNFTRRFLERLVQARELDLEITQFKTMAEATKYAADTTSSLLYLSLECCDVREDAADEVANYAGTGIGLTTMLRGTPIRLTNGEVPIPLELFHPEFSQNNLMSAAHGEQPLTEAERQYLQEAVNSMAATAVSYLAEARERQHQIPKSGKTALLPIIPAVQYLSRLEKTNHDILDAKLLEPERLGLLLTLGRTWLTGVY